MARTVSSVKDCGLRASSVDGRHPGFFSPFPKDHVCSPVVPLRAVLQGHFSFCELLKCIIWFW